MGESYLSGVEYRDSTNQEQELYAALQTLQGKKVRLVMKNDDITVLVDCQAHISDVVRHENRIETGHLTMDDVFFALINDAGVNIYFPLVQFKAIQKVGYSLNFIFDTYQWSATNI
ncbi:MAG: hypothetical protein M0Z55_08715 [Peptococcaceae bacterium]|nr:hypothetical protein [Peptococcaceae bacterium]